MSSKSDRTDYDELFLDALMAAWLVQALKRWLR